MLKRRGRVLLLASGFFTFLLNANALTLKEAVSQSV